MKINKHITDEPYCRAKQFTKYRYIHMVYKKKHKIEYYGGGSVGWKTRYRAEAKGYHVRLKMVDPGWVR